MTMDIPNLGGNAFFLACHVVLLFPQIYLGLRHKTWGFLFGMFCGHVLEIIGYVARIRMHNGEDGFLMYIVTLTIGPAFFSASIYLCLARIITVYGEGFSRFTAGGSILGGDDPTMTDTGLAIIKTGLAAHLAAISIFVILASELGFRIYRHQDRWNIKFARLQRSWRFNMFLICLGVATLCILIRTSYRVAELSGGYDSKLANDEVAFMILEGAMIVVATVCLAVGHPGICFEGRWDEANFQLRKRDDSGEFGKTESDTVN
ncbi:hypothetical protein NM208_g1462 [Fusarium decemcellulare]|uniref:Uncharacterized protein n=1 Tax=Fusarium decemcellulare TaxID=57161 RepID=A0ACC1SVS0_9HYPO|nr:hypothetical protein NM208_g1462 [Fusarium decemcellulare]